MNYAETMKAARAALDRKDFAKAHELGLAAMARARTKGEEDSALAFLDLAVSTEDFSISRGSDGGAMGQRPSEMEDPGSRCSERTCGNCGRCS